MMKEWATVVSWQQGVALLRCEPKAGCGSCTARSGCGARALNELVPETEHQLQVHIDQPLNRGSASRLASRKAACCAPPCWFT